MIRVKIRHVLMIGGCRAGARAFIERHGLDWAEFRREGLPVEQVEATRDAMALKVAEVARGQQ